MSVRIIPSLPRGGIVNDEGTSRSISRRIEDAYIIQNDLNFMTGPVTGNDGVVYTWVEDDKERTGFVNSGGYARGNPSSDIDDKRFTMYDKVGNKGSYILKLGYSMNQNHRWLRGVVGFDMRVRMTRNSTSSTNDPWLGKVGLIYREPLSQQEYIYLPTVTMKGPTGDVPHTTSSTYTRLTRKLQYNGGPHQDLHDLDLLFTGIIFEYGHGGGGGAVETDLYLSIKDFKPIFSEGKNINTSEMAFNNIKNYELIPRMRPWSERDDIRFDTNVTI